LVAEFGSLDVKGSPFGRAGGAACSLRAVRPAAVLARAARPTNRAHHDFERHPTTSFGSSGELTVARPGTP
jgi:hypothetical protein